jgi:glycerate kinase
MKVVIAIDSFKGSVSSMQAGEAVRRGVLSACPGAKVQVLPLADGGEGTMDALSLGLGGEKIEVSVKGPLGEKVSASYVIVPSLDLAIIEIVQAAGLVLVEPRARNPLNTTTFGVGELILDAMERGYRKFMIGLGGSATNDAGFGMLSALGFRFYDAAGSPTGVYGEDVMKICDIDVSGADPRLNECTFIVASDVNSPLCGVYGASAVFGPQKGATADMIAELDAGLKKFAEITAKVLGKDLADMPGAGAAGGLGFAFLAYLHAVMKPGVEVVLEAVDMDSAMRGVDYAITGEGRLDDQTVMGKAPLGVASLAKKHGGIVIALSGSAADSAGVCNQHGIDAYFSIMNMPMPLEEALDIKVTEKNLETTTKQLFLLIQAVEAEKEKTE